MTTKINYHDLLEKVLFNIAWDSGMETLDILLEEGYRKITQQERQVIEHLMQNIFEHPDIV